MANDLEEPLDPALARETIRAILVGGTYRFTRHAEEEMAKDALTRVDCVNVLRGGWLDPAEFENGSWRYRVHTQRITVVVAFRSREALVVVTAWRVKS